MSVLILCHYKWIGYSLIILIFLSFFLHQMKKGLRNFLGIYGKISIIGLLYPTTKIAQFFLIGPNWYRGYFADIGAIAFLSLLLFHSIYHMFPNLHIKKNTSKNVTDTLMPLKVLKICTFIVGIIVMAFEIFQIEEQKVIGNLSGINGFTGRGDFNDLFIFFIMLTLQVCFLDYKKNKYLKLINQILEPKKSKRIKKP
jgi:hypothetical protein